jgi:cysteine synthase A
MSAGATVAVALQIANSAPENSVLLAMLPDTGERYLHLIFPKLLSCDGNLDWQHYQIA